MVSVADGFRLFDTELPGHVVTHGGSTVRLGDGDGKIQTFDAKGFSDKPKPEVSKVDEPHHGIAVRLDDGSTLHVVGNDEERSGATVIDRDGKEIASSDDCLGVHGEATAKDETIALGCEDGTLLYKDGKYDKIVVPDDCGRIGNQAGSEDSRYALGDYKVDEDAGLERP
jgi:hypothetical protein